MNQHPAPAPPPPRRIVVLQTTADILNQTTFIVTTPNNLLTFLFLSFLLHSQRLNIDQITHDLTSYIDNEPSIKSLFSRVHEPPNSTSPTTAITTTPSRRRHHRGPALPLTRAGTLDVDFFSGDDEFDPRLFFGTLRKSQLNVSSFNPQFGSSNSVSENVIRASRTVRSSSMTTSRSVDIIEKEENVVIDEINDTVPTNETAESKTDPQSLKRSDHEDERHKITESFVPFYSFIISYGYLMFGITATYAYIHGIIFVLVVNHFCKRYNPFVMIQVGASLGFRRSSCFNFMRLVVGILFTLFLGFWFFRGITDRFSLLKIAVRLMLMPYSIFVPWVKGFEKENQRFILPWLFVDLFISFVLTLNPWIVMADQRKNWREVVKEGWNLLLLRFRPACDLKGFESIVCGPYVRWVLAKAFGDLYATAFQSSMEVYFMVAWMIFYLSMKSVDANSRSQTFGQRELEAMLEDRR